MKGGTPWRGTVAPTSGSTTASAAAERDGVQRLDSAWRSRVQRARSGSERKPDAEHRADTPG